MKGEQCDLTTKGGRFKFIRASLRLSQNELAKTLGVSEITVRRWELGKTELPQMVAYALKALYNVNPDWLLYGEGEPFLNPPNGNRKKKDQTTYVDIEGIDPELLELLKQIPPEDVEGIKWIFKRLIGVSGSSSFSSSSSTKSTTPQKEKTNSF